MRVITKGPPPLNAYLNSFGSTPLRIFSCIMEWQVSCGRPFLSYRSVYDGSRPARPRPPGALKTHASIGLRIKRRTLQFVTPYHSEQFKETLPGVFSSSSSYTRKLAERVTFACWVIEMKVTRLPGFLLGKAEITPYIGRLTRDLR